MTDESAEKKEEAIEIDLVTEFDLENHLKTQIPKSQKMSEDVFRAGVVTDMVSLQVLVMNNIKMLGVSNKNFLFIQNWMKAKDEQLKSLEDKLRAIEEKLSFLELEAKNDDPKKKTDHYLS